MLCEHLIVFVMVFKLLFPSPQTVVAFHPIKKKIVDHRFYSMLRVFENTNRKLLCNVAGGNDFFDFHFL